jgi:hypothetical protein
VGLDLIACHHKVKLHVKNAPEMWEARTA